MSAQCAQRRSQADQEQQPADAIAGLATHDDETKKASSQRRDQRALDGVEPVDEGVVGDAPAAGQDRVDGQREEHHADDPAGHRGGQEEHG